MRSKNCVKSRLQLLIEINELTRHGYPENVCIIQSGIGDARQVSMIDYNWSVVGHELTYVMCTRVL